VLAIELAFSLFGSVATCRSHLALSWRKSSQAVTTPEAQADILCFGDSLIKLGVLPRVIEDCLGLSAYNLAVLAGQPASSFFLFRRALESGHRPSAVIVDFSAPLLTMPLRVNTEGWAEIANCREAFRLAFEAGDPALGIAIVSRWLVPSRASATLMRRALVVGQVTDPSDAAVEEGRVFERNWRQNRGAQVAPRQFVPIEGALPQPPKEAEYKWRPQTVHAAYVARFLSLARAHAIPVFWVLPPVVPARRERLVSSGIIASCNAFVSSFLTAYPGVTILDGDSLEWDTRAFRDPIHLNRDGAVAFSVAIARTVARRLDCPNAAEICARARHGKSPVTSGSDGARPLLASRKVHTKGRANQAGSPRWIHLDAPWETCAPAWDHIVEDLEQSRKALDRQRRVATDKEEWKWSRMPTAIPKRAVLGAI